MPRILGNKPFYKSAITNRKDYYERYQLTSSSNYSALTPTTELSDCSSSTSSEYLSTRCSGSNRNRCESFCDLQNQDFATIPFRKFGVGLNKDAPHTLLIDDRSILNLKFSCDDDWGQFVEVDEICVPRSHYFSKPKTMKGFRNNWRR